MWVPDRMYCTRGGIELVESEVEKCFECSAKSTSFGPP